MCIADKVHEMSKKQMYQEVFSTAFNNVFFHPPLTCTLIQLSISPFGTQAAVELATLQLTKLRCTRTIPPCCHLGQFRQNMLPSHLKTSALYNTNRNSCEQQDFWPSLGPLTSTTHTHIQFSVWLIQGKTQEWPEASWEPTFLGHTPTLHTQALQCLWHSKPLQLPKASLQGRKVYLATQFNIQRLLVCQHPQPTLRFRCGQW